MINWIYFPKSSAVPDLAEKIVRVFEDVAQLIQSKPNVSQYSNTVLARVRPGLEELGFLVERGKSSKGRIAVPVLFGRMGKPKKSFYADAYHEKCGWVLEVEAGQAVTNNKFLKNIFQACMMSDVQHLAIAVRNEYRKSADFSVVEAFLETLYVSGRIQIPLRGILLIGY